MVHPPQSSERVFFWNVSADLVLRDRSVHLLCVHALMLLLINLDNCVVHQARKIKHMLVSRLLCWTFGAVFLSRKKKRKLEILLPLFTLLPSRTDLVE